MEATLETRLAKGSMGGNRDDNGRYLPGHAIPGLGAPYARRVAELRSALLAVVTPEDVALMIRVMVDKAKAGDAVAFRRFFWGGVGRAPSRSARNSPQGRWRPPLAKGREFTWNSFSP